MESTQHVFQKAEELTKCLQRCGGELQRRISLKMLEFQATAITIETNSEDLLAGDSNGSLHRISIRDLVITCLKQEHNKPIRAICSLGENEFITGGDDRKIILWRENQIFEVREFNYPVTSVLSSDKTVWVLGDTNIATKYKISENGLGKETIYQLRAKVPTSTQLVKYLASDHLLYHTEDSIELWNTTGLFVSEEYRAEDILAVCPLKDTNGIAVSIKHHGIYLRYYGGVVGKYFHESEGEWTHLLSLNERFLVSIGKNKGGYQVKFWKEAERICVFEISLDSKPLAVSLDKEEVYLIISLQGASLMKIKLRKKYIEKEVLSEFPIVDFIVSKYTVLVAGERNLHTRSRLLTLQGPITCYRVSNDILFIAESNEIKIIKYFENIERCDTIMENNLPIRFFELVNNDKWIIIVGLREKTSQIVIFDLVTNKRVCTSEKITEVVYSADYIGGMLVYSTDSSLNFVELSSIDMAVKSIISVPTFARIELSIFSNKDQSLLFCAGKNGIVDIIELEAITSTHSSIFRGIIISINTNPDNSKNPSKYPLLAISLNSTEKFLIIFRENEGIQFWKIDDQIMIWNLKTTVLITKILADDKNIYFMSSEKVQVMNDPTYERTRMIYTVDERKGINMKENITIVGPEYNSICLLGMIASIRDSSKELYDPSIYDWVILPQCINILHILAFYQDR